MEREQKRRIVEALILASPEPLSAARIAEIIPYCKPGQAKDLVNELNTLYEEQDRAFEIWEVAGGYQLRTRAEFSGYLQKLQRLRPLRLSRAALETLSVVAYKQPATRAEVEEVRGVDAGAVLKSLLERDLVRIAGHREVPGRPIVYATTKRFLEVFGLASLKELPTLREIDQLAAEEAAARGRSEGGEETAGEAPAARSEVPASTQPETPPSAQPGAPPAAAEAEGTSSEDEAALPSEDGTKGSRLDG